MRAVRRHQLHDLAVVGGVCCPARHLADGGAPIARSRWIGDLIERTCYHARRFGEGLAALQADGTCWCVGTIWQGQAAMRISVVMGDERSVIGHTARRWHAGRLATDLTMHTVLVIHEQ